MYKKPKPYEQLKKQLKETGQYEEGEISTLLNVEMGLYLLQYLQLGDEPITTLWIILSGTPIYDIRLQSLTDKQKHAIANARILLPYSARFSWQSALRDYHTINQKWRCYTFDVTALEQQIIDAGYKANAYPERIDVYQHCLETKLAYKNRNIKAAKAGEYYFDAEFEDDIGITKQRTTVILSEEVEAMANIPLTWFNQSRPRNPLQISYQDLEPVAKYINNRENTSEWTDRLASIRYCVIHQNNQNEKLLGEPNTTPLKLNGMAHIAGMVASGKSTLMTLLAAYAVKEQSINWRITLIVGDTMSALKLADKINCWFCNDPEIDTPVAVALLGRTTRHRHLRQFYASENWRADHWGHRWLNTACPLQALVSPQLTKTITPGKEPCGALKKHSPSDKEKTQSKSYTCPLFAVCPSQQMYRDMPHAQIWVTTPGALGRASLPASVEERTIKLGDIIYEQSDIVVFDEVDTIQEWFDHLFAQEIKLTAAGNGVLDELDEETTLYFQKNRIPPPYQERWIGAERLSITAVSQILRQLNRLPSHPILKKWLTRNYFTAFSLFYKLARRMVGLKDFVDKETTTDKNKEDDKKIDAIFQHFQDLLETDPLTMTPLSPSSDTDAAYQLAQIMQFLATNGDGTQIDSIQARCKQWIIKFVPNIKDTLANLQITYTKELEQPKNKKLQPPDTLDTLAQRLAFILSVALLDRNIRIVFYEWHNRPPTIDREQPHRRSPSNLVNVLPLPPTGRLFGTYYSKNADVSSNNSNSADENSLSLFGYTNVGRWYVMNFHKLRQHLECQPGPHVLALSGTSHLPDSSRWHFNVSPQGVLKSVQASKQAIAQSHFEFLPQYEEDKHGINHALRISGSDNKLEVIKKVAEALAGHDYQHHPAHLRCELETLKNLGDVQPEHWQDRDRLLLLVNSYDQTKWATHAIAARWSAMADKVFGLQRDEDANLDTLVQGKGLNRADIETFATTQGKILVAPMQAIGRGFNILNNQISNKKAAFGTIYFLTRPMPHPFDTQAIAQEHNRRTLDWFNDKTHQVWQEDGVYRKGVALRKHATYHWRSLENRSYYKNLDEDERRDLAATTAGLIIQACGRLLRGGVPFRAYFVDAAWGPKNAGAKDEPDTPKSSLLAAMIEILTEYSDQDIIGAELYEPLANAMVDIKNFTFHY